MQIKPCEKYYHHGSRVYSLQFLSVSAEKYEKRKKTSLHELTDSHTKANKILCIPSILSKLNLQRTIMYVSQLLKILTTLCLLCHTLVILVNTQPDSIAISCGSSGNTTGPNGRVWIGDFRSESSLPLKINGKPSNSKAIHQLASSNSTPYETARISRHEFSYVFPVKPGHKFIRLHFHHDSYKGFKGSRALFTIKAGPYTLLSTFSPSLTTQIKEYCLNIKDDQVLTINFTPARKTKKSDDFYAFINGIEVVSMPTGLYFTLEGELGARVVGQKHRFFIDNSTALEMVQRLNIGGISVSPAEDSGMFRKWDEDSKYLSEAPTYIATNKVYETARCTRNNLTWKIPVDSGFRYLIRLHFSELQPKSNEKFSIIINNQIIEDNDDVIQWGAVHTDYIVMMEGDKTVGKRNLTITFRPKFVAIDEQFPGKINGLELFKLSNPDNNLAGMEPVRDSWRSKSQPAQKKQLFVYTSNFIAAVLTIILLLLNIVAYHLRKFSDSNSTTKNIRLSKEHPCRQFSVDEIRSATNNFNPQFHIGSGGYGRVYKGSVDNGATIVAIKRSKSESTQVDNQFWTEIKMLSKIRHENLVSLIGYCNDGQERLLIYQYMTRGTLADHIYKMNRRRESNFSLSWESRLKIAIGAARGLYFLHSRHRVIHRDVKSSNILLDDNWVAKISDFGLSKIGPANESFTHISTNVRGTFGYLDPEYFLTRKLTRKSDVYAFGVVLFEVLNGRPAIDIRLDEEQHSLAGWARYCIREAKVERLIDENLMDQISQACLKVFLGIAGRCLHTRPQGRPAMADVVMGLELALALQQNPMEQIEEGNAGRIYNDHSDGVISMEDVIITPPTGESERITSEDIPSQGPRNRGKTKDKNPNGNSSSRWWWDPFGILPRTPSKSIASAMPPQVVIHEFSLQEIQKATNNFHQSLIIGSGGSDDVYKGYIDGGQKVVSIRWSRTSHSRLQMAHELQSKKEIQMKPLPSQHYVALLIGYCETESNMMLVYDYMSNGTLHDHLHEPYKDPLPWKRRLQICIGVARELSYLNSTVKQTLLHRDLRSTNIWLDDTWIPKVSEWGLSKNKGNDCAPENLRGKWGYFDSDYIRGEELTEKSYVYSFGIVLFEVLFADIGSERWMDEDQVSLAQWIKSCMRTNLSGCIDPFLVGRTSRDSLESFIETAGKCLFDYGIDRPSMSDVITRLEAALKQEEATESNKGATLLRS